MAKNLARNGDNIDRYYTHEKISNAARNLASIVDLIDDPQIPNEDKLAQIKSKITSALFDMTKILSAVGNGDWDVDDCELIVNCGNAEAGYEAIHYKYGKVERLPGLHRCKNQSYLEKLLKERTILKAEIAFRMDFCEKMLKLLDKKRNEVRSLMNNLLDQYSFTDPCYLRMNHLLDDINMTSSSWSEFCVRMKANVEYLKDNLSSENGEQYVSRVLDDEKERRHLRMQGKYVQEPDGKHEPFYERQALKDETA
jgi:hypothetical protein